METIKEYTIYNEDTKVTMKCSEKYLLEWLARGFKVVEITDAFVIPCPDKDNDKDITS